MRVYYTIIIVVVVYILSPHFPPPPSPPVTTNRYSFSSSSSYTPAVRSSVHGVGWPLSRRKKKNNTKYICPFLFVFINRSRQHHHNNVLFVVVCQPVIIYATCITLSTIRIMYNIHTCVMYTGWLVWYLFMSARR